MKCVCQSRCQKIVEQGPFKGRSVYFTPGQVEEFKVCPINFAPLAGETKEAKIDFAKASEEELREAKFTLPALKDYMDETHPSIKFNRNIGKDKLIDKLLRARDNDDTVDNAPTPSHISDL